MTLEKTIRMVYFILAAAYAVFGVAAISLPPGWLPQSLAQSFLGDESVSPLFGHVLQEFGSLFLVLGGIFFWYAKRASLSLAFHWIITIYFLLNALVHWFGPSGFTDSWSSGVVNSIPFVVMSILGVLQRNRLRQAPVPNAG